MLFRNYCCWRFAAFRLKLTVITWIDKTMATDFWLRRLINRGDRSHASVDNGGTSQKEEKFRLQFGLKKTSLVTRYTGVECRQCVHASLCSFYLVFLLPKENNRFSACWQCQTPCRKPKFFYFLYPPKSNKFAKFRFIVARTLANKLLSQFYRCCNVILLVNLKMNASFIDGIKYCVFFKIL